jgi:predicted nucleotidyltransferase
VKEPVLTQDFGQAPLKVITSEVALHVPALSVYLTGSMARGFGGYRNDYDIIVVLKTLLVPLYLRRLKAAGRELSHKLGSKVEVNPLPTFRLRRAKGSLFLMKAKDEAKLLLGEDVLTNVDTGHGSDICPDWYFSFFSSLLKDLLDGHGTSDVNALRAMVRKMAYGLEWLSKHAQ